MLLVMGILSQDGRTSEAYCEEGRQAEIAKKTHPAATPPCTPVRLTPSGAAAADVWIAVGRGGPYDRTLVVGGTTDEYCGDLIRAGRRDAGSDLSSLHCLPAKLERR